MRALEDFDLKKIYQSIFPSIIGVYYIENNQTTCMGNTYRSIDIE